MKIALLTCSNLEGKITEGDQLLQIFKELGHDCQWQVWNAPVDWNTFDVALIRTTWDYTQHLSEFINVMKNISRSRCRLVNDFELVKWNATKTYLRELEQKGVEIIPSIFLNFESQNWEQKLSGFTAERFAIKPTVGANSTGITLHSREEVKEKIRELVKNKDLNWFVQCFQKEVANGERSLLFYDHEFSHGVKKVPKSGDYRSQEEWGSHLTAYFPSPEELDFSNKVLTALKQKTFYARVDYLLIAGRPQLMELEIIEPALYFRYSEGSARTFALAFERYLAKN